MQESKAAAIGRGIVLLLTAGCGMSRSARRQLEVINRFSPPRLHEAIYGHIGWQGLQGLDSDRPESAERIVGMLEALGAEPQGCGYDEGQVASVLSRLGTRGVAQELPGSEHLYHLLVQRGKVESRPDLPAQAKPHPEVLKLRFDPERSPPDTIPNDLREKVYRILLEHADGAVRRSGRVWVDFDPLSEESLSPPYRFERARRAKGQSRAP